MKKRTRLAALCMTLYLAIGLLAGCGGKSAPGGGGGGGGDVDPASLAFPLAETAEISGLTSFPAGAEQPYHL